MYLIPVYFVIGMYIGFVMMISTMISTFRELRRYRRSTEICDMRYCKFLNKTLITQSIAFVLIVIYVAYEFFK